jgi:hypothetical protein
MPRLRAVLLRLNDRPSVAPAARHAIKALQAAGGRTLKSRRRLAMAVSCTDASARRVGATAAPSRAGGAHPWASRRGSPRAGNWAHVGRPSALPRGYLLHVCGVL